MATSSVSVSQLEEVARAQGVTFRRGDILLLRFGFIKMYYAFSQEERTALGNKEETL